MFTLAISARNVSGFRFCTHVAMPLVCSCFIQVSSGAMCWFMVDYLSWLFVEWVPLPSLALCVSVRLHRHSCFTYVACRVDVRCLYIYIVYTLPTMCTCRCMPTVNVTCTLLLYSVVCYIHVYAAKFIFSSL